MSKAGLLGGTATLGFLLVIALIGHSVVQSKKELEEARDQAKRAKEDRDDIVRLTAGGWKFEKPVPYKESEQLERRIEYLQEIYESSIRGRSQTVRDLSLSIKNWDKRIQEYSTKLAVHREELKRLKEEGK